MTVATLSNLTCGALRAVVAIMTRGLLVAAYEALRARTGLIAFDATSPLTWVLAFVAYDFVYYGVHRLSHAVPFLWAGHAVHHQAKEMEPSVLLRAGAIAPFQAFPFYALLAVLGIPTAVYLAVSVVEHTLMAWLHTRRIGSLGPIGWVLNTPRHHRLHHAASVAGGGVNLGCVLIVWDRLFGTHRLTEVEPRKFGIARRALPLDPLSANLLPWRELLADLGRTHGWRRRLRALVVSA